MLGGLFNTAYLRENHIKGFVFVPAAETVKPPLVLPSSGDPNYLPGCSLRNKMFSEEPKAGGFDGISFKGWAEAHRCSSAHKSVLVSPIFKELFYNPDSLSSPISLLPFTAKFLKRVISILFLVPHLQFIFKLFTSK